MKRLYEFSSFQGEGDSKVERKFFIAKPTRVLREKAEFFSQVKHSEAIKGGILPAALVAKRLLNDDGVLSEKEKEEFDKTYSDLFDAEIEMQKLLLITNDKQTEETKKQQQEVRTKVMTLREKLQKFQLAQSSLYNNTAEIYARNKTIFWWVLQLSYEDVNGQETPFFGPGDYEKKLTKADEIEETNDPFEMKVVQDFIYYLTIWYVSGSPNESDFQKILKEMASGKPTVETNL